ncbi:MAG: nitroreductase family protein [Desulfobacterales bacterium]|jgi:nitroreductase/NAD-dependent dihydropyrimidine dehydrogenase PreA subunit|nr:nitroreductase family protein [Desulfobacterales bacterium]
MSLSIDLQACTRCRTCVEICPAGIIAMTGPEEAPAWVAGAPRLCIHCGHCVAVCPESALSLPFMAPADLPMVRPELAVSSDQMVQLVRSRRSIRVYRCKPVDQALLAAMIDLARHAPTAKNLQPVRWLVVRERETVTHLAGLVIAWMQGLVDAADSRFFPLPLLHGLVAEWAAGRDRICRNAPHLIVAYGAKTFPPAMSGCLIALTTLELAAPAFGLGACWAGYFDLAATHHPPLADALNLPDGHQSYGALMIGYPKFGYPRMPLRNPADVTWR